MSTSLTGELYKIGLYLDKTKGFDTGVNNNSDGQLDLPQWLSLAAIIVGSILLIMVIFLAIAYKLRVSK